MVNSIDFESRHLGKLKKTEELVHVFLAKTGNRVTGVVLGWDDNCILLDHQKERDKWADSPVLIYKHAISSVASTGLVPYGEELG